MSTASAFVAVSRFGLAHAHLGLPLDALDRIVFPDSRGAAPLRDLTHV